jgi:D-sedoheptulose 7-phosphate isomerase
LNQSAAAEIILSLRPGSGKVILNGNGGSAAIVSHMHNDLCKAAGLRAMVFNETPLLTALSNDEGYESVFERPVEPWAKPGDVLLAVSSSGQSENILRSARASLKQGCQLITFTGFRANNPLRQMDQLNLHVPSQVYGYVETAHAALGRLLTDYCLKSLSEVTSSGD